VLAGQRPLFIGEFGPYIDDKMFTHENVVEKTREFFDYIRGEEGISGALIWSMYFHHERGGFYWHQIMTYPAVWSYHWPGFPSADAQREQEILTALREAAFAIQGLPVARLPVPDAPELLPIGDCPLLSWRGSAGATSYDVQRASRPDGPWTTVIANVCDGDVAYRPLASASTVRAGQTWFYRVTARNASGVSKPSNVAGPVHVRRACLADELKDFSISKSRSPGVTISNDYNALYAEYLFRAKGAADDWIVYESPAPLDSIKVTAFFAKELTDMTVEASADGARYAKLVPHRDERRLPGLSMGAGRGQKRTMVEYESPVPPGQRFLRIRWNGPTEVDRVELYYR